MTWGRREELLDIEVQRKEQIESERQEAHHEQQLARDELGGRTIHGTYYTDAELPTAEELRDL